MKKTSQLNKYRQSQGPSSQPLLSQHSSSSYGSIVGLGMVTPGLVSAHNEENRDAQAASVPRTSNHGQAREIFFEGNANDDTVEDTGRDAPLFGSRGRTSSLPDVRSLNIRSATQVAPAQVSANEITLQFAWPESREAAIKRDADASALDHENSEESPDAPAASTSAPPYASIRVAPWPVGKEDEMLGQPAPPVAQQKDRTSPEEGHVIVNPAFGRLPSPQEQQPLFERRLRTASFENGFRQSSFWSSLFGSRDSSQVIPFQGDMRDITAEERRRPNQAVYSSRFVPPRGGQIVPAEALGVPLLPPSQGQWVRAGQGESSEDSQRLFTLTGRSLNAQESSSHAPVGRSRVFPLDPVSGGAYGALDSSGRTRSNQVAPLRSGSSQGERARDYSKCCGWKKLAGTTGLLVVIGGVFFFLDRKCVVRIVNRDCNNILPPISPTPLPSPSMTTSPSPTASQKEAPTSTPASTVSPPAVISATVTPSFSKQPDQTPTVTPSSSYSQQPPTNSPSPTPVLPFATLKLINNQGIAVLTGGIQTNPVKIALSAECAAVCRPNAIVKFIADFKGVVRWESVVMEIYSDKFSVSTSGGKISVSYDPAGGLTLEEIQAAINNMRATPANEGCGSTSYKEYTLSAETQSNEQLSTNNMSYLGCASSSVDKALQSQKGSLRDSSAPQINKNYVAQFQERSSFRNGVGFKGGMRPSYRQSTPLQPVLPFSEAAYATASVGPSVVASSMVSDAPALLGGESASVMTGMVSMSSMSAAMMNLLLICQLLWAIYQGESSSGVNKGSVSGLSLLPTPKSRMDVSTADWLAYAREVESVSVKKANAPKIQGATPGREGNYHQLRKRLENKLKNKAGAQVEKNSVSENRSTPFLRGARSLQREKNSLLEVALKR